MPSSSASMARGRAARPSSASVRGYKHDGTTVGGLEFQMGASEIVSVVAVDALDDMLAEQSESGSSVSLALPSQGPQSRDLALFCYHRGASSRAAELTAFATPGWTSRCLYRSHA
eukprot:scaffold10136_cov58-Phaeocystis_antarctica.AAC.2